MRSSYKPVVDWIETDSHSQSPETRPMRKTVISLSCPGDVARGWPGPGVRRGQSVLVPPTVPDRTDARRVSPNRTDIKVNVVFANKGIVQKIQAGGREQPRRCGADRRCRPARCAAPGRASRTRELDDSQRDDPRASAPPRRSVVRAHHPGPRRLVSKDRVKPDELGDPGRPRGSENSAAEYVPVPASTYTVSPSSHR